MSRITTSSASFSRARAAMRRACSRGVRVCSRPWIAFLQCSPGSRTVKPALRDEPRDGVRYEPVERLAGGDAPPNVSRSGRIRLDLEEEDTLGPLELLDHRLELAPREAGPGGDRDPRPVEDLGGFAPGEKALKLIGAQHEHGIVETLGAEQLDRARIGVEPDVVPREGSPRERETTL